MSTYHEIQQGVGYFLYLNKHQIVLKTINKDIIGRPLILASDYLTGFSSTLYNSSVYYSYINEKQQLVVRASKNTEPLYHLDSLTDTVFIETHILSFQKKLFLFYVEKTDNIYHIKCLCPFEDNLYFSPEETYKLCPNIHSISGGENLSITVSNDFVENQYIMDEHLTLTRLNREDFKTIQATKESVASLQGKLQAEEEQHQREIEQLYNRISDMETTIEKQQTMLQSATEQYEELMNVASCYRDEAIKWRSKLST